MASYKPACLTAQSVAVCLLLLHAETARAEDEWLGRDKALHCAVSAGLSAGGYAASSLVLDAPWQRGATGAGFALTLGAGKELWDLHGHGDPSWKDFTWDIAGAALGIGVALAVDLLTSSDSEAKVGEARAPLGIRW